MNKVLGAAAAVVLLILGFFAMTASGDPDLAGDADPRTVISVGPGSPGDATSDPGDDPTESPDPGEDTTIEAPAEAVDMAEQGILAYTQNSFRDATPTTWIDRVGEIATPGFKNELVEVFGEADAVAEAMTYWLDEVVAKQRETRTEILDVVVSGFHEQSSERYVLTVTYETSIKTSEQDWTEPAEAQSQWVTVERRGSGWRVANIVPTSDRQ